MLCEGKGLQYGKVMSRIVKIHVKYRAAFSVVRIFGSLSLDMPQAVRIDLPVAVLHVDLHDLGDNRHVFC
jgi:hypothetical protein